MNANQTHRECRLLTAAEALNRSPAVKPEGLKGALWSGEEMIIESRVAVQQVATYLHQTYNIHFHFNTAISRVEGRTVYAGKSSWRADEIFVQICAHS